MEQEEFTITVDSTELTVKTKLPVGPDPVDHEVWKGGDLLFIINPHLEESDSPHWKLTSTYQSAGIEPAFVQMVGEAIESYYL